MSWLPASPRLGVWVKIPAPEVVEALAAGGIELVAIDCEHGAIDRRSMSMLVGLARALGMRTLVRVSGHGAADLQAPLDAGADGLLIPHVDSAADARAVIDAGRFPPLGRRGGRPGTRAGGWGEADRGALIQNGNHDVTLIAQIESPSAVSEIEQIVAVDGLDGVMAGPFDLALASALPPHDPALGRMVQQVEDAARGFVLGGVAASGDDARSLFDRGYTFVLAGGDTSLLAAGARALSWGATR